MMSQALTANEPPIILPPATLGVIGSGQLGRMFIQTAQRMGYRAGVLSEHPDAPAVQVAHWAEIGADDNIDCLRSFGDYADAITVEFENVSASGLRWLARHKPVRPGWRTVWVSQNRLREKSFLTRHQIPHAPWRPVRNTPELDTAIRDLGLPLILKTSASGYDGKGQILVHHAAHAPVAWSQLNHAPCVAEAWVEFIAELSVIVARGHDGQAVTYPVALNQHHNHILDTTTMPAPIGPVITQEAQNLALATAQALETVGVLTVEFFLASSGNLLVNEIAPRPHNSGHLTIEAACSSQFEQQVRTLCGLPLGSTQLVSPAAMVNLLGDLWTRAPHGQPRWDAALAADPAIRIHLYGKHDPAPGRKMGHITVVDPNPASALTRALAARRALTQSDQLAPQSPFHEGH